MSPLMTKPTKWHVCPVKTQISLGIHPIWSESSLSSWRGSFLYNDVNGRSRFDCYYCSLMSPLMTKPTKWHVCPVKTQISLGIRPIWSESSLSAWRKLGSLATHWVHSKDSDQTGQMPRLIWVCTGRHPILLVLSWGAQNFLSFSYIDQGKNPNLYTKDCLEKALSKNEQVKGKIDNLKVLPISYSF